MDEATSTEPSSDEVVQVITDNANVMKATGALIEGEYPKIFWTTCVVRTLNLALKNICVAKNIEKNEVTYEERSWIIRIADDASFIHVFIMNHSMRNKLALAYAVDLAYVHSNLQLLSKHNEEYVNAATKI
ncbi:hypothetical protein SO802_022851 [Lithocarpus litseifolius]|uniref:DUF659 domain-containing protein n=1 Tax=Lithocarpus litseifolius TaxID=425828 RepID=A0AAW2C619_9ROSI